ncbi:hypothetical protein STAL104432_27470 [Streptomyces albus]
MAAVASQARAATHSRGRPRGWSSVAGAARTAWAVMPRGKTVAQRRTSAPGRGQRTSATSSTAYPARAAATRARARSSSTVTPPPAQWPEEASRSAASAEMASAPVATQWSPRPVRSCRGSNRSRASAYRTIPTQKTARPASASQPARSVVARVAARTAMLWVATQIRKTAPGIRRPRLRRTAVSRTGHSTVASTSRAIAAGRRSASASRVPTTAVAATPVSAAGVCASASSRERAVISRRAKSAASRSQAATAMPSAISDTIQWPAVRKAMDRMPVAITMAPAAGGIPAPGGR